MAKISGGAGFRLICGSAERQWESCRNLHEGRWEDFLQNASLAVYCRKRLGSVSVVSVLLAIRHRRDLEAANKSRHREKFQGARRSRVQPLMGGAKKIGTFDGDVK